MQGIRLRPYRPSDEREARAAHVELADDGFSFLLNDFSAAHTWDDYLASLDRLRRGVGLPPGWVPSLELAAVAAGTLVGRSSIRLALNDHLATFGGHIGYAVRPAWRRKGYATRILAQSVVIARAFGVEDVVVCCDDRNVGSASVIELCGGRLDGKLRDPAGGELVRRYVIS